MRVAHPSPSAPAPAPAFGARKPGFRVVDLMADPRPLPPGKISTPEQLLNYWVTLQLWKLRQWAGNILGRRL